MGPTQKPDLEKVFVRVFGQGKWDLPSLPLGAPIPGLGDHIADETDPDKWWVVMDRTFHYHGSQVDVGLRVIPASSKILPDRS